MEEVARDVVELNKADTKLLAMSTYIVRRVEVRTLAALSRWLALPSIHHQRTFSFGDTVEYRGSDDCPAFSLAAARYEHQHTRG